jgi:hypothetical protein
MAPRSGALIAGITRFVEDIHEIKEAVSEMENQGVDVVSVSVISAVLCPHGQFSG